MSLSDGREEDYEEPSDIEVIHAHECVGDFWIALREAIEEAGGDPDLADFGAEMTLKLFAECVAPNGIRMVFCPEASISEGRQMSR